MKKFSLFLIMLLAASVILGACGSKKEDDKTEGTDMNKTSFKVAMVTDVGGIDDKSFNQSAWEGLKNYGKKNNLKETQDFHYLASHSDADYNRNLNDLTKAKYDLVYGIGYIMKDPITKVATENPDTKYAIVDEVVNLPNVASITFAENEGSFLVGVVAAMKTKTKKLGFVGGMKSPLIEKFEAGFRAGVEAVDPTIQVEVNYTGAFDKPELGKATASAMYKSNIDIIYHASGYTGKGVFTEAIDLKEADPTREIWVIGVDKDQAAEGMLKDNKTSVTLTSMMKRVDVAVEDIATLGKDGKFPGGKQNVYDLKKDGVGIAPTQTYLTQDIKDKVNSFAAKIKAGEIKVPETPKK